MDYASLSGYSDAMKKTMNTTIPAMRQNSFWLEIGQGRFISSGVATIGNKDIPFRSTLSLADTHKIMQAEADKQGKRLCGWDVRNH
jgi:hypothetical protein